MPEIGNERDVSYCCHPPGQLPNADAHVAQMLHLVTDEDDFRETGRQRVLPAGRACVRWKPPVLTWWRDMNRAPEFECVDWKL